MTLNKMKYLVCPYANGWVCSYSDSELSFYGLTRVEAIRMATTHYYLMSKNQIIKSRLHALEQKRDKKLKKITF